MDKSELIKFLISRTEECAKDIEEIRKMTGGYATILEDTNFIKRSIVPIIMLTHQVLSRALFEKNDLFKIILLKTRLENIMTDDTVLGIMTTGLLLGYGLAVDKDKLLAYLDNVTSIQHEIEEATGGLNLP